MLHSVGREGEAGEVPVELFAAANTPPLACGRPVAARLGSAGASLSRFSDSFIIKLFTAVEVAVAQDRMYGASRFSEMMRRYAVKSAVSAGCRSNDSKYFRDGCKNLRFQLFLVSGVSARCSTQDFGKVAASLKWVN